MGIIHTADLVLLGILQLAAQSPDGRATLLDLLLGGFIFGLEGQEQAAHLQIGQAQLGKDVQRCHGPGHHDVKALADALFLDVLLGTAGDGGDRDVQRIAAFLDELDALAGTVQRGDVKIGIVALEGHGGESGAAADIQNLFALKFRDGQQKQTVQHMPQGDLFGLGDGGEIHHPVFFDEQVGKTLHAGDGLVSDGQIPLITAVFYNFSKSHLEDSSL